MIELHSLTMGTSGTVKATQPRSGLASWLRPGNRGWGPVGDFLPHPGGLALMGPGGTSSLRLVAPFPLRLMMLLLFKAE